MTDQDAFQVGEQYRRLTPGKVVYPEPICSS